MATPGEVWAKVPTWLKAVALASASYGSMKLYEKVTEESMAGKVVLITGAGSGIGRLMALKFAKLKARLVLWDINPTAVQAVAEMIVVSGGEAISDVVDVTDYDAVAAAVEAVKQELAEVDVLINNAGVVSGRTMLENSPAAIRRTFEVNTVSHFWTVKAVLPDMIRRNSGHIVTVSSASAFVGVASMADYVASKWAVYGFNESLRVELRKKKATGVYTTCVCPYYINTGMFDGVKSKFPMLLPILEPDYVANSIVTAVRRKTAVLVMPKMVWTSWLIRLLVPTKLMDVISDFLGTNDSMDEFKGRRALSAPVSSAGAGAGAAGGAAPASGPSEPAPAAEMKA